MKRIELLDDGVKQDEIQRIRKAANDNLWVKDAYTVKDFLKRIEEATTASEVPF